MTTDTPDAPTTLKAYLKPIDSQGLAAFAAKGCANPASRGTTKVKTVMQGMYRSLSYVGNHAPVVVDEPLHLFGEDTAPAPGEIVLSGLGRRRCAQARTRHGLSGDSREGAGRRRREPRGAGRDRAARQLLLAGCQ